MQGVRRLLLGLVLIAGVLASAAASDRLVLYEYFNNTS
jgi:hypothetical protein